MIVMLAVVLVLTIAIAFLSSVSTERTASSSYKTSAVARQLANTAVSIVQAQIRAGTSQGPNVAWTSQPGLIRDFDNSGQPLKIFKLYSSGTMQSTGNFSSSNAAADIPADWFSRKDEYVDLNSPVSLSGTNVYPILDPSALGFVQGFDIDSSAPVATGSSANAAPMPVSWIYVLQDGQAVPYNSSKITPNNPVVGRIAFWTDDETAKINLNTASEGVYWDTPRAIAKFETDNLARYQPASGEYQRYPGHPAMNCLSPVLGKVFFDKSDPSSWAELLPYYQLSPRTPVANTSQAGTAIATTQAVLRNDRLFPDVDEVIFDASRNLVVSADRASRAVNFGKFFLTTSSRAPDVNLFNRPKVLMWPISVDTGTTARTALDNLMAFCGTINGSTYYFQRKDPNSAGTDLPTAGAPSGLGRNRMLLTYLRKLMETPFPGFGGDFLTKYGADRDQISTEIFDYIRCTNLQDTTSTALASYTPKNGTAGSGQVVPIYDSTTDTRGFGRFPTVSEAFLLIIGYDDPTTSTASPTPVAANKIRIQAVFLPEMFTAGLGYSKQTPDFGMRISGLNAFTWNGTSMGFPASASMTVNTPNFGSAANPIGGAEGINYVAWDKNLDPAGGANFPFYSTTLDVSSTAPGNTLTFTGGDVTIELLGPDSGSGRQVVQTLTLNFPSATLPVPAGVISKVNVSGTDSDARNFNRFEASASGRFTKGASTRAKIAWITSKDVVRSVRAAGATTGDIRLIAARNKVEKADNLFEPEPRYSNPTEIMAHSLFTAIGNPFYGASRGKLVKDGTYFNSTRPLTTNDLTYSGYVANGGGIQQLTMDSDVPGNGVLLGGSGSLAGDWDNGVCILKDGPYINKADEGDINQLTTGGYPYFTQTGAQTALGPTFFSANRQIPSAGMLGSLSSGVKSKRPWQTLLFRPDPTGLHPGNPGRAGDGSSQSGSPGDFLLLDLFQMPVVEPYAISEPLSTMGRVNMNYQIMPFTYLKRETGIWSVLKAEQVLAIPTSAAPTYKLNFDSVVPATEAANFRKSPNVPETLKGFQARFDAGDVFRSAAEICQLPLVPSDGTYSAMNTYWSNYALTGDNSRERPYANIYPRLTTRSNTFTVHFKVEALTSLKSKANFNPTKDFVVSSEYRGSCVLERFIDPNNKNLPDFADIQSLPMGSADGDINKYYQFRALKWRQFSP